MLIELTVRNIVDIPKIIEGIVEIGATKVALTDKNGMPDNLFAASEIREALPNIKIITYYSLKNHTSKVVEDKYEDIKQYFERAGKIGVDTVLLVSGSQRPKFDTLAALDFIKVNNLKPDSVSLAVAYNPFLDGDDLTLENQRLRIKADSGLVDKVYLQIGTDITALTKGVEVIKKVLPNATIGGSLIVPTPYMISSFRLRPWKGVIISPEFLSSLESAFEINKKLTDKYAEFVIEPIYGIYTITPKAIESLNIMIKKIAYSFDRTGESE